MSVNEYKLYTDLEKGHLLVLALCPPDVFVNSPDLCLVNLITLVRLGIRKSRGSVYIII